jgi:hypothetical protein
MLTKKVVTLAITVQTDFENFESLSIVDAGSDGFRVIGENADGKASAAISIPTGIPYNIGSAAGRIINKLTLMTPASGSLNASVSVIY